MGAGEERRPFGPDSDPRDEELIRRLQAGGDDPLEALRGLEGDVDAAELAELENVLGMLSTVAAVERRTVQASSNEAEPAVLSAAEVATLSRQATGVPTLRFPVRGWAAAAAVLMLALAAGRFSGGDKIAPPGSSLDPGPTLGSGIEAVQPLGESQYERFEWKAPLVPGGFYRVHILDASQMGTPEITASDDRYEPSWTPKATASWPDSIIWEVVVFDGDGIPSNTARFEASRSRP